jgi:hypothetical protein
MRSPKDMRIIQIDITNACVHECSNCIRFCGHHKKPYFMEWEMFKKSVDSLQGFGKCIGIMGGEPTLHPQFERFVEYIAEKYPLEFNAPGGKKPIKSFSKYIHDRNYFWDEVLNNRKGIGLWTSVSKQYFRYYELIQDHFSFQNINDHDNSCIHQPILVSRKEMGISDEEWIPMRDNCICQNLWSASITPKGAFFCEVAGALDMLFHGPGGWKVESGWWNREPSEFGEQLNWCELCGGALFNKGRLSNDERDDVSPLLYNKLMDVGSPKIKRGKYIMMDACDYISGIEMPETTNRYLTDHKQRVSQNNKSIYPTNIEVLSINKELEYGPYLSQKIDEVVQEWCLLLKETNTYTEGFLKRIKGCVLNPGVLYSYKLENDAEVYLFHKSAQALKRAGYDGIANCISLEQFFDFWEKDKQVGITRSFDYDMNPDIDDWERYAEANHLLGNETVQKCLKKIRSDYDLIGSEEGESV